ncbi:MAG: Flp family type IVb pilin [Christensenella sp.]|nr:Flp family type IVb pilin [Christensenella sp.]
MKRFWMNEEGQGMVEYGLIIALVAIVVIVGLGAIGTKANGLFGDVGNKLKIGS